MPGSRRYNWAEEQGLSIVRPTRSRSTDLTPHAGERRDARRRATTRRPSAPRRPHEAGLAAFRFIKGCRVRSGRENPTRIRAGSSSRGREGRWPRRSEMSDRGRIIDGGGPSGCAFSMTEIRSGTPRPNKPGSFSFRSFLPRPFLSFATSGADSGKTSPPRGIPVITFLPRRIKISET